MDTSKYACRDLADRIQVEAGTSTLESTQRSRRGGKTGNSVQDPERFLTEQHLADRWQVSVKKLQNDRVAGEGPPWVRIGRAVRYRLSDVKAYEAANTRTSTSDKGGV